MATFIKTRKMPEGPVESFVRVDVALAKERDPGASGITGATVYVDKGYHSMGAAADSKL